MGVPKNFRDAKCCLICTQSEVTDSRFGLFLHCTKFDTACEDTTTCDEWEDTSEQTKQLFVK
jgi:hypothetical protein